ncbi:MAG TPA: MFS transporter [Streptosporangiaceae bacterium]|jgi:dipeptide/tripeptide permease|nr:MFS transporter [Streptosporangiaceae bacterium]
MTIMAARRQVELPRTVRVLAGARAVNQLGAFSLAFLTVMMCRVLGASLATAGAVSALFGLATIPSRLIGGRLADRLGQRRTVLTGLIGCAAAQLGIAAAPDLTVAAVCAVLLGLAFELYEPPSQAMIADATEPAQRTHAYALLTTALAAGNMGAGLIADAVGHSGLRWLFVLDAASCLACALIVRLALPAGDRRPASKPQPTSPDEGPAVDVGVSPWRDPRLLAMTAAGTVFALVYMLILVGLPLSLSARGLNPANAGLVMATATLMLVVTRPMLRIRLVARLSGQLACGTGFALMAAGLAGYASAHSLAGLLAPTAIWSVGNLLLSGRAFAIVTALAPPGGAARYLAVYGLSWGVATVAAPVLATQVIGSLGPAALWSGCAVLCAAMSCGQPALMRAITRHSPVPASAPPLVSTSH